MAGNEGMELKENLDKLVVGADRVLKLLPKDGLKKVFVAKNCPLRIKNDIEHYATLAEVPFLVLEQNNEELGIICKKNFLVAVVGLRP